MMLENLILRFDRHEGGKLVFKTDKGKEIFLDSSLLDYDVSKKNIIYLSIDSEEIKGSSPKSILNEILDS